MPKPKLQAMPDYYNAYSTRKSDCISQGGSLQGLSCVLPPPPAIIPVSIVQTTYVAPVTAVATYSGSITAWLLALRTCEAGGNYAENTGNGFYGAYQFTVSSWDSLDTGYSRADLAPPSVQDAAIIANTNRSSGGLSSQNPGCFRSQGLSAFPPS